MAAGQELEAVCTDPGVLHDIRRGVASTATPCWRRGPRAASTSSCSGWGHEPCRDRRPPLDRSRATRRVTLVGAGTNAGLALAQLVIGWLGPLAGPGRRRDSHLLGSAVRRHRLISPRGTRTRPRTRSTPTGTAATRRRRPWQLRSSSAWSGWGSSGRRAAGCSTRVPLLTPDVLTLWAAAITTLSKEALYRYADAHGEAAALRDAEGLRVAPPV